MAVPAVRNPRAPRPQALDLGLGQRLAHFSLVRLGVKILAALLAAQMISVDTADVGRSVNLATVRAGPSRDGWERLMTTACHGSKWRRSGEAVELLHEASDERNRLLGGVKGNA